MHQNHIFYILWGLVFNFLESTTLPESQYKYPVLLTPKTEVYIFLTFMLINFLVCRCKKIEKKLVFCPLKREKHPQK
jgi:hypothetical protein